MLVGCLLPLKLTELFPTLIGNKHLAWKTSQQPFLNLNPTARLVTPRDVVSHDHHASSFDVLMDDFDTFLDETRVVLDFM